MTTTPPDAPTGPAPDEGPRVSRDEMRDLGRLRRSASDRKVAGVAGGLARHLDIDPLVLRVAFVVLALFGGAGLLLYGACWLLVPEEETGEAVVGLDERSRTIALVVVGALAAFALVGDSWGVFWFPWPLAIIALVVLLMATRKDRPAAPPSAPTVGEPAPAVTGTWGYGSSMYGWQGDAATPPAAPPAPPAPAWTPPPRDPRRRGPVLFWFTLALIALGVGVLGMVDVAGATVPASAYPALTVGLTGVMLLVGSVYGRAGGLILLGLVSTVALAGATAVDNWDGERHRETPLSAAEVDRRYDFGAGDLVLDLTEVSDLERLDGRALRLEGGVGEIRVIVPDGLDVEVDAQVGGPGNVVLFGDESGGIATEMTRAHDGGTDVPSITIDAQLGVGEIRVDTE